MRWTIDRDRNNNYFTSNKKIQDFHNLTIHSPYKVSQQSPIFYDEYRLQYLPIKSEEEVEDEVEVSQLIQMIFKNRRSSWDFREEVVSKKKFLDFLKLSIGTNGKRRVNFLDNNDAERFEDVYVRSYPSGGALYPIKIYIYINNVEEFKSGIYEYRYGEVDKLCLIKHINNNQLDQFTTFHYDNHKSLKKSNFIVYCATDLTMKTRYGLMQYKLSLLEVGHIAQNLMLSASYYHLNCVPIGGYFERQLNEFLGIDKINETVLYFLAVG